MNACPIILSAAELSWAGLALSAALILLLVALSGTFSGSETVLFSLSRVQLDRAAKSQNPFRRIVARVMARPKETLLTILIANTTVNVLLYANTYVLFQGLANRVGPWVTPLAGVLSVLLVVIGGEVVPKVLGVALADRLAPYSATIVRITGVVAEPLGRWIDLLLAEPFVRLCWGARARRRRTEADLSADELKALLELSRRSGTIRLMEDMFLRPIVDLPATQVSEVMVPRVEMTAYDVNGSPDGLRTLMRETQYRKIPVYDGNPDNIIGLVYAKRLFFEPDTPLRDLVQPVRFVPELASCEHLLVHFRQTRSQLAIAIDEHGGVAGLVTLEDILEEIVGELHEPEDRPEEPDIKPLPNNQYEISGQLSVEYWGEAFGLTERTERVATVGGLIMARLGRMARVGDTVQLGNVELKVTRLRRRSVDRLQLRLVQPDPPPTPEDAP
jgi:CBS domain containing-hemolysin-like protein